MLEYEEMDKRKIVEYAAREKQLLELAIRLREKEALLSKKLPDSLSSVLSQHDQCNQ